METYDEIKRLIQLMADQAINESTKHDKSIEARYPFAFGWFQSKMKSVFYDLKLTDEQLEKLQKISEETTIDIEESA